MTGISLLGNSLEVKGQSEEGFKRYENRDMGIGLSYPSYWGDSLISEGDCGDTTSSCSILYDPKNETSREFLFVISAYNNGSKFLQDCNYNTLVGFVQHMYKRAQEFLGEDNISFLNDNQTQIANKYPAWQVEYSSLFKLSDTSDLLSESEDLRWKHHNVYTKVNDTLYEIIFVSYNNRSETSRLQDFKNVVESIEFFPQQKQVTKKPSFLNSSNILNTSSTGNSIPFLNKSDSVTILSHNSYTDDVGYFHVVGEVENNTPDTAEFVQVTGTFYDINNAVVGTQFTYTNPSDIISGGKAPFDLVLTSASVPTSLIDHYELQASYQ
jgi:hypothetical protein